MSPYPYNPACYLPQSWSSHLPTALACPPPPSFFTNVYNYATSPFSATYTTLRTMIDALLGLPMLSFLLIPTFSSYSTSLNLLFFYLTWSTLVLSHPPLRVELVATLAVKTLFYILPSAFFVLFDALLPSAAENFKALGDTALPFKNASRQGTIRTLRALGWSLLNTLLGVSIQALVELLFTRVLLIRSALRVTTTLPLPFGILKDLAKGYLLREVFTYVLHRYVLHESKNSLSRAHNEWYHSISTPFPLSGSYDHPLAYLVRSFLPTYLPALLFRFHLITYVIYVSMVSLEETFAYSGYSTVPTNFILGGMARRTDTHLMCDGEGNYGPWGLVDWFMGTAVGQDMLDDVAMEAEKHDVPARVEGAKRKASRKVSGKIEEAKSLGPRRRTRKRSNS
ncbi:uncharacterized protein PV06_07594 [Exophiala oligosperma]|uniref:Fatty acid hydroxylase domain-containing protein n=2 Tax=Chaetothyriales TaxID=34395 RepID=A0A0D2AJW7_9EURO|nr:uncharacterized protein PV06_07594 [Exophiala oligosperma]KAJ9625365.1 hypothetical protein H2204_010457 [Knufia peltigerae]KIW40391.1 hypothetical protein PV06_07594 [Exophiala oligosperma]